MRTQYRFIGQRGGRYYWQQVVPPGSTRLEVVSVRARWFWRGSVLIVERIPVRFDTSSLAH